MKEMVFTGATDDDAGPEAVVVAGPGRAAADVSKGGQVAVVDQPCPVRGVRACVSVL